MYWLTSIFQQHYKLPRLLAAFLICNQISTQLLIHSQYVHFLININQFYQSFIIKYSLQKIGLQTNSMWNFKDSNKIIGMQMKVDSFKRHITTMRKIKAYIKMQSPWKSSFSLSKYKNKYHKVSQSNIDLQNKNLLRRLMHIQSQPMEKTVNVVSPTRPSQKQNYSLFKSRQRSCILNDLYRENAIIYDKIESANSLYGKNILQTQWKQNRKYKENLKRKQYVPDYSVLAKYTLRESRKHNSRPQTALTR